MQDELHGTIDKFLFQNQENGYSVFTLQTRALGPITVTGYAPNINAGQEISVQGTWKVHPKFGKQFEAASCTATLPTSTHGLKKYLSSGLIKGIGPVYAEKLVNQFGTRVLEIIDKEPDQLRRVPGIGPVRADKIIKGWSDQKEISRVAVFLQDKGISLTYALKIYKQYGAQSLAVIQENPYRLADEIWGIGFKTADTIAQKLGIAPDAPARIVAGIVYAISQTQNSGHLYVQLDALKKATIELLELDPENAEQKLKRAFHDLYDRGSIKLVTYNDQHYIGLAQSYFTEKGIAAKIQAFNAYAPIGGFNLDAIYTQLRSTAHAGEIALNEDQQRGIMNCLQHKITIITGGPGTGKTTLIKKLLGILDEYKITYRLAAPTGRAAKRITQGCGRQAATIHRLLEYDFTTRSFAHHEQNALKLQFLIVDEASMIDIFLAHAVLKALPMHAHLVLIGDVDQLPSVGAGNFLHDLIASGKAPCTRLHHIFRQAQDSLIVVNAHRVNAGEFPTSFLPDAKRDFIFIKEDLPENVPHHLKSIFGGQLQRYGIATEDATVLVPMNRGAVGTQALNHTLQEMLNPQSAQSNLTLHGTKFGLGDRVMQIRNNYDKLVFNGDIGTIESIDADDRLMMVQYGDRSVEYDFADLDELVLAYAITIHKSQGSEYAAAIIPIFMQHFTLLQRNLLYTAITRAKKLCILIGQPKAIGMAISNNKGTVRTTFLQQFLTTDLQCR